MKSNYLGVRTTLPMGTALMWWWGLWAPWILQIPNALRTHALDGFTEDFSRNKTGSAGQTGGLLVNSSHMDPLSGICRIHGAHKPHKAYVHIGQPANVVHNSHMNRLYVRLM